MLHDANAYSLEWAICASMTYPGRPTSRSRHSPHHDGPLGVLRGSPFRSQEPLRIAWNESEVLTPSSKLLLCGLRDYSNLLAEHQRFNTVQL